MTKPDHVDLDRQSWLMLLMTADYLRRVSRAEDGRLRLFIGPIDPRLALWIDTAIAHLDENAPALGWRVRGEASYNASR